jgi:hypothetical protein
MRTRRRPVVVFPPCRRRARLLAILIVAAAGAAAALVVTTSSRGAKPPSRSAYLARAQAICHEYGPELDRIPPIQDPTLLGSVIEATDRALPVLREQAARIRALTPPPVLRTRIARFFALTDRSLETLQAVRDSAKSLDSNNVGTELIRFGKETAAAKRVGRLIGYRC